MKQLAAKFRRLKTAIGGNREKQKYEEMFGPPLEERQYITRPNRACTRILAELEFVLHLSEEKDGAFDLELEAALDFLLDKIRVQGVITNQDCEAAEEILAPVEAAAKEYSVILAGHAHIDMNWMWGFQETVAITLATFRSVLNIMDQYPQFCFSQSQASVYKIVEEYDSQMMEEIKARIAEGRWEVTATDWVETDKNMPDTESMLRHIQYTKEYMSEVWGVKNFELEFEPDTFGHHANVPEINAFGDVKYLYHCRGNARDHALYLFRSPSGKEIMTYREPHWYNSAVTPHIATDLIEVSKRSAGLKTGLILYGVGDHGGGPTRRDVERALEMMTWKIYPNVRFGTILEFFKEAESVRDKLPVIDGELNYFAPGCYTTQSRIKRGNRRTESALYDAEAMSVLAGKKVGMRFEKGRMMKAWQDLLFTHFHDILTGSCVQDTREHAMGLYQTSMATANTQIQNAMRRIGMNIDTSSIPVDIDAYNSQSEGAGVGYGIENFVGVPSPERGSGRTRIFHVFNTLPYKRKEVVELTVWDWTGDLKMIQVKDYQGNELVHQRLDREHQTYWDHRYFRILVDVEVPALGYTTVVLSEKEIEAYPVHLQRESRISKIFDDYTLENDLIYARLDSGTGRIESLKRLSDGVEMIAREKSAGFSFIETERRTSSAWEIGRHIKEYPVDRCVKVEKKIRGPLRESVCVTYEFEQSKAEVTYILDRHQAAVRMEMKIDWHEIGKDTVPVFCYRVPLAYHTKQFRYDIPAGYVERDIVNNDVPALKYGMALNQGKPAVLLSSDCKYGFRGLEDMLSLTLINSSVNPDPYPERGIHAVNLWLGICEDDPKLAEEMAWGYQHKLFYQPSNCHYGTLPMESGLAETMSEGCVVTAIVPQGDEIVVRGYNVKGEKAVMALRFEKEIEAARAVNLFGEAREAGLQVKGNVIELQAEAYSLFEVVVKLK